MLNLSWTPAAWDDYQLWLKTDKKILKRINLLIKDAMRSPFEGKGKPEGLRFDLAGCWSRRITQEHRLIYHVDEKTESLVILACRLHYK